LQSLVVRGFHGTSQALAESVLATGFHISQNEYDWLGDGIYFFQDAPQRARQWAEKKYASSPAVLSADITLEDCIDLLDTQWFNLISDSYNSFLDLLKRAGMELPG